MPHQFTSLPPAFCSVAASCAESVHFPRRGKQASTLFPMLQACATVSNIGDLSVKTPHVLFRCCAEALLTNRSQSEEIEQPAAIGSPESCGVMGLTEHPLHRGALGPFRFKGLTQLPVTRATGKPENANAEVTANPLLTTQKWHASHQHHHITHGPILHQSPPRCTQGARGCVDAQWGSKATTRPFNLIASSEQ